MKILVPFDFSEASESALSLAQEMCVKLQAELKVVHALGIGSYPYYHTQEASGLKEKVKNHALVALKKAVAAHTTTDARIDFEIVEGKPATHIVGLSRDREVVATVMGRKPKARPEHISSTTQDVIRHAEDAVISLAAPTTFNGINTILFVTDFESTPINALSTLKKIQRVNDAKINLLYVNTKEAWQTTTEIKVRMEKFCKIHGLDNAGLEIVNELNLEKGVLTALKNTAYDLVAIKIHGSSGKTSVSETHLSAERIMDHTHIPVLTYAKEEFVM